MPKDYNSDYDYIYKILIIGNSGVGKSSILLRFTDNIFKDSFISTIGVDFKVKTIQLDNRIIKLQLWDTAGQERFKTITHSYYRGAHGVILVFDLTDKDSFNNLEMWLNEIKSYNGNEIPILLVGNKEDLREDRKITEEEINEFVKEKSLVYLETSSKDDVNIYKIFESISRKIKEQDLVPMNIFKLKKNLTENTTNIEFIKKKDNCCV